MTRQQGCFRRWFELISGPAALRPGAIVIASAFLFLLGPIFGAEEVAFEGIDRKGIPMPTVLKDGPFLPGVERIKKRGSLRVAQFSGESALLFMRLPKNLPKSVVLPDSFIETLPNGERVAGVDIRFAKLLASELGVKLELLRNYPSYDQVVLAVAKGEADVAISNLNPTSARQQLVHFSTPYCVFSLSLICNRKRLESKHVHLSEAATGDDFARVFDSNNISIGVIGQTSWDEEAHGLFPNACVTRYPDFSSALLAVRRGELDACFGDDIDFLVATVFDPELSVYCSLHRIPGVVSDSAVAVSPESKDLLGLINKISGEIRLDNAAALVRRNERTLKKLELAKCDDPSFSQDRAYPYSEFFASHPKESGVFSWRSALAAGVLLCSLAFLWLAWDRMTLPPKRRPL